MTWVLWVMGTALALGAVSWAVETLAERIEQALTDVEPTVDDPTERRRLHAIVEWKRL
jgi:hypothetical protein